MIMSSFARVLGEMPSFIYMRMLGERIFSKTSDHYEQVKALHEAPMFRSKEHILGSILPEILASFLFVSTVYLMSFVFVDRFAPKGTSNSTLKRRKMCYQITNFFANLLLGLSGMYVHSQLDATPTVREILQRDEDQIFATFQLGYQLWAIPVGLFWVQEEVTMLLHHLAVINAATVMAFFTNGVRYWCPFLMGGVEVSSVPLAVMNAFKDNKELIEKHKDAYLFVRTAFAIAFLYIRVWMFMPRNTLQSFDHVTLLLTNENIFYKVFHFSVFLASTFLTFLQLKWGYIVARGFFKVYARLLGDVWITKVKRS